MNLASDSINQSNPSSVRRYYRRCSVTERTLRDILPLVSSSSSSAAATTADVITNLPRHAPDALDRVRIRPPLVAVRNEKRYTPTSTTPSPSSSVTHRTLLEAARLLARISDDDDDDDEEFMRFYQNRALQHPMIVPPRQLLLSVNSSNDDNNGLVAMTSPLLFRSTPSINDCYTPSTPSILHNSYSQSTVAAAAAAATIDNADDENVDIKSEASRHIDDPCLMMMEEDTPYHNDSLLSCVDRKRPCIDNNGYHQDMTTTAIITRSPKQARRE